MGFSRQPVNFLAQKSTEGSFGRTATIGRHWLFVDSREVLRILQKYAPSKARGFEGFSEGFLQALGSSQIVSFDASDYEDATVVHDMNVPLPIEYHEAFDTVIDSGSLEHVFDVRTALKNVMSMPCAGGRLFLIAPANNLMGHGLYQFSPDLYFRALSSENGYRINQVHLAIFGWRTRLFIVTDPMELGKRVELRTGSPVYIFVEATRERIVEPLTRPIQQSDYSAAWAGHRPASSQADPKAGAWAKLVPYVVKYHARRALKAWRRRNRPAGITRTTTFLRN